MHRGYFYELVQLKRTLAFPNGGQQTVARIKNNHKNVQNKKHNLISIQNLLRNQTFLSDDSDTGTKQFTCFINFFFFPILKIELK